MLTHAVEDRGETWDCESVLSLRSNLDNHPRKILEQRRPPAPQQQGAVQPQARAGTRSGGTIRLSSKTGLPVISEGKPSLCSRRGGGQGPVASLGDDAAGCSSGDDGGSSCSSSGASEAGAASVAFSVASTTRLKGETSEERRARKSAVKEAQRASRVAKKELKTLFKEEAGRQRKQAAGRGAAGGGGRGSTYVIP